MSAILVHGGAGSFRSADRAAVLAGVRRAVFIGWSTLSAGSSAVEAVEAATRALEDDPLFNAGYGSALNLDGEIEVDAIIMDGASLDLGAVAAVPRVRHAVTLARRVMTDSPHHVLAGVGAERFARAQGLIAPAPEIVSPASLAEWRRARAAERAGWSAGGDAPRIVTDTVGAVAVDSAGHVAAATSTGGMADKWAGRVGDSPLIGSGAYADDRQGAASCTGHGERIMRICMAYSTCARIAAGATAQEAADGAMEDLAQRTGGEGGLIVVSPNGELGWAWNTPAMPYAWRTETDKGAGM